MKNILFLFLTCFILVSDSFSQNYNWITPNKTYLKLYVNDDGIYRLNKADFAGAGVNAGNIDPRTVKVLHKGNQIPIYFQGEEDGVFDDNDFFDFYGKRNYGGPTPHLDAYADTAVYTINEYYNLYSDTNIYWVGWEGSNGERMEKSTYVSTINYPGNTYMQDVHFEQDLFYDLGETLNPNSDYRYFSTEIVVGEGWYWKKLTNNDRILSSTAFINDLSSSPQICTVKVFIKPVSFSDSLFNEHQVEIKINNVVVATVFSNGLRQIDTIVTFSSSALNNNADNEVTLNYTPLQFNNFSPVVSVDFMILKYPRQFALRNNLLSMTLTDADSTSKVINVSGFNSVNPINVYDINNYIRIESISPGSGNFTFTGKSNSAFEIINNNITKKPFRIKSRQVRDLVSGSNAADYLIIYNKLFESQSEQLKSHRQSFDNYRVMKAEIEDIYDIFNYGMEHPVAVRYFVKHAYENWLKPSLRFVCLFGRASLDPKKSDPSTIYSQNFVPTYGNPSTDGYFVNFNLETYIYTHQIAIGRLPVYTSAEAQNVVDKIINYDLQQPDKWWKNYIAITGGPDRQQQISFQSKSNNLVNNYITVPPVSMVTSKIYRNDSANYITYNYKDSIKKEFDRGALLVNFIGHAASQDWEIGLENPNTLNNGNKQPFVLSFTCFTGKNSERNFRSFGENFLLLPNKCAIAFLGSTGWSYSTIGDLYNEQVIKNFSRDSVRYIGELVSYASNYFGQTTSSFPARNTVNCYNLIGDPATRLLIGKSPEFDIKQNDYALSNSFPALGEIIKLSVYPKNVGTYVNSLKVKFQIKRDGIATVQKIDSIQGFGYIDTLDYFFSIDTIGNYTMTVTLDPDRKYPQRLTNNDSITFPITLRNLSYVPVKPLDNGIVNTASFRFTGLNPNINAADNEVKVILQVDTSKSFSSPAAQTFNSTNISGISTSFNVNIPVQEINTLYFTRTNAVINSDSSGWSDIRKFIYNPSVSDIKESAVDSAYTIYILKPQQYSEPDLQNVTYTPDGFLLDKFTGSLQIRSYGSNAQEASYFIINNGTTTNITYYSDAGANTGLNIAKVRKVTGQVLDIENFRMNSPVSTDSVLNFLNSFDQTQYLMAYIASYVPARDSFNLATVKKFREFGSIYADSIKSRDIFDLFDTWSFYGFLGADTSQTSEKFHRYASNFVQEPLDVEVHPVFQKTTGSISHDFGAADKWKNFSWDQVLSPNSSVAFDIIGIDRDNIPVLLRSDLTNNALINLDTIDYYTYPNLRLTAKLMIDSVLGLESPVLKSTDFRYYPPCELVPDNYSFTGPDSAALEGDSISFSVNYYNAGFIDAPVYYTKWYVKNQSGEFVLSQDTVDQPLAIDSMRTSNVTFSTAGLRDPKIARDTIDLYFEANLAGDRNELFSFNNKAITKFVVTGDTLGPLMDITYDGVKIINGDFVQAKPNIELKFFDDSRMVINDTLNIKVYIASNNIFRYVPYYINGVKNPQIDISFPDDRFLQAIVTYRPELQPGEYKFRYVATDITGNFADSVVNTVIVDNNLRISGIANYPNPMKTETSFMFNLSGELNPTTCKVKIYSVAGRVIKEINSPAIIGYNNIYWDGKDNDGDYIANGTYLYKFIIQGNSQVETSIQKLAVLR